MEGKPLVIHDFFLEPDGGGKVACHMASLLGADLVAGHVDSDGYPEGHFAQLKPQSLGAYDLWLPPFSRIGKLWRAFASLPVQERPLTMFSGQVSPLAFRRVRGPRAYYCHTPPRLLYDKKEALLHLAPLAVRPFLKAMLPVYRKAYEEAVASMDLIVCNSETVRRRIKTYLSVEARVVAPPAGDGFVWQGRGGYYLSSARLDSLKRVEVIVRAFLGMPDKKLVVTGEGYEADRLRRIGAGARNITFTGQVSDARMKELVGRCIATIHIPEDEDFGIGPIESMAAGKPVIGVREGGLRETVVHGETGTLLPSPPSASALAAAVAAMDASRAASLRGACEARAKLFVAGQFDSALLEALDDL